MPGACAPDAAVTSKTSPGREKLLSGLPPNEVQVPAGVPGTVGEVTGGDSSRGPAGVPPVRAPDIPGTLPGPTALGPVCPGVNAGAPDMGPAPEGRAPGAPPAPAGPPDPPSPPQA